MTLKIYLFNVGTRKKYLLDDGTELNIFEVIEKYEEKWDETMSESLAFVRLANSTNPEYIFSKKGRIVGHEYCKKAKAKKLAAGPKKNPKILEERSKPKCKFDDSMWKLINQNI